MAQRLSEVAANIHPEQIATELFTKAKTFFLDLKAKIAWVLVVSQSHCIVSAINTASGADIKVAFTPNVSLIYDI